MIATSTGRNNYRHQADALAQYQMLRGFGYDDEHIILILEDDLDEDVHVTIGGENLRAGAVIDYKTSRVTPEDLRNIFSGTVTERTPQVVQGGPGTNVFLFWSGHGARDGVLKWADKNLEAETFRGILEAAEGNYRKMLAVMETCYSGSIGSYCEGIPGVLFLCATRNGETSHADIMEDGIYLSNRFTRVFRSQVEANPAISLHDLYYQLATHTTASHAGLYNDACYGVPEAQVRGTCTWSVSRNFLILSDLRLLLLLFYTGVKVVISCALMDYQKHWDSEKTRSDRAGFSVVLGTFRFRLTGYATVSIYWCQRAYS